MKDSLKRAQEKYYQTVKQYCIIVNKTKEKDILDHLAKQENIGRYVKDLIKKDMEK